MELEEARRAVQDLETSIRDAITKFMKRMNPEGVVLEEIDIVIGTHFTSKAISQGMKVTTKTNVIPPL